MGELLSLEGVYKSYRRGARRFSVLVDVALEVRPGQIVAVIGPRHAGKTTLLKIAAGLEKPDAGAVRLGGLDLAGSRMTSVRGSWGTRSRGFIARARKSSSW
jgi:putative ABC transport system ATP-binding protein